MLMPGERNEAARAARRAIDHWEPKELAARRIGGGKNRSGQKISARKGGIIEPRA